MNDKKKTRSGFNEELNVLFEKLLVSRENKLKNIEEIKKKLTSKLDNEIKRLHDKRDLVKEIWRKREELTLHRRSVIVKFMENSLFWNLRYLVSMPFIYIMIIPALLLHFFVELYHNICFRLYGIPLVRARDYFIFDRKHLPYLNWLERFNCFYCSYFNCLISYVREIGGRTERYWCPIKHSKIVKDGHSNYDKFVDYDDAETLREKWGELRAFEEDVKQE